MGATKSIKVLYLSTIALIHRKLFRKFTRYFAVKVEYLLHVGGNIASGMDHQANAGLFFLIIQISQANGYPCLEGSVVKTGCPLFSGRTGAFGGY